VTTKAWKRPFLKWAGCKFQSLEHLCSMMPTANRLVEPFAGSGVVFLNMDYPSYVLAEENADLINLFTHVQHEGLDFIEDCATYFCEKNNEKARYYTLRDTFNACTSPRERALLFVYLNRHGYNGLCRFNASGYYNVPFGRYITPFLPRESMLRFHEKSQQATFLKADFRKTFAEAKPDDLIYCDPPYVPLMQESNFNAYTRVKFGKQDQIDLAELSMAHTQRGGCVLISNHDTPFTRELYQQGEITSFAVHRHIGCNSESRKPVRELLALFCADR